VDPANVGWQAPVLAEIHTQHQPTTVYVTQPPGEAMLWGDKMKTLHRWLDFVVTSVIMQNQSRIGLYPVKLQPCPHCQRESKTTIKQESTLRTHLLALILCVTWWVQVQVESLPIHLQRDCSISSCCCCIPFAYMTDNMTKTANHFCEHCNAYIGSYRRKLCGWISWCTWLIQLSRKWFVLTFSMENYFATNPNKEIHTRQLSLHCKCF
jgi:LITAF-like zinc ribbon domain